MGFLKSFKKKKKNAKKIIDPEIALDNLLLAKKLLDSRNMPFWLTDGTLLGYYRDNGFIEHDEDIDLGCFITDFDENILFDFLDNGFRIDSIYGNRNTGLELSFMRKNMKLDIFFFYKENDRLWHGAWIRTKIDGARKDNLIRYYYDSFELKEASFYGIKINIPENTEKYVIAKYGKNWKQPVKEWDWAYDPSNSVKTDIYL